MQAKPSKEFYKNRHHDMNSLIDSIAEELSRYRRNFFGHVGFLGCEANVDAR